ncbi:phosphotransferase [Shewanella oneidensis MR-1]|uniref:Predicted thiamine kinase ThiK n=1 Tax=Shewanella oneidensis (strain ATCC 700550 / JCM 31522 / CIP 106686 / LMG 19005 / NCIMB 14063 / MR-1) TaxID=211586 RepID=Q8EDN1_SHEON|nr:phosphotransferase [Shewanella oneidensis]AAN55740.1 predicted thiamine kinase ThiK [Shewanella oneidensis MR-1]MDX5995620.1 phosphotransferase [Shewanella oneidensis]MEE2026329.1 Thiamine kinase [Shewanella oneidensis]QKG97211.1 phosphotransferase [Shewanella oneidensis MR-1]
MLPLSAEEFARLVPILRQAGLSHVTHIHELAGGLSNHNYHIQTPTTQYALRLNAEAADRFCSREQELFYWRNLAKAKLAPELIWTSCDHRYYLSAFIESQDIASLLNASQIPDMLGDWADVRGALNWKNLAYQCSAAEFTLGEQRLQTWLQAHAENFECALHQACMPQSFAAQLTPLALLESQCPNRVHSLLLQLLQRLRLQSAGPYHISVTEQWQQYHQQLLAFAATDKGSAWQTRLDLLLGLQPQIHRWTTVLADCLVAAQFCHRDLNPHNLLLKDNQLYCIDFEYATASHPLCELAVVLATHRLTPVQRHILVRQYLADHPGVTSTAITAVPAAIDMYWVFALYWALLIAAQTDAERQQEYLAWFDSFWSLVSQDA